MATNMNINIELGSTFWLLLLVLITGLILWRMLGSERCSEALLRSFEGPQGGYGTLYNAGGVWHSV